MIIPPPETGFGENKNHEPALFNVSPGVRWRFGVFFLNKEERRPEANISIAKFDSKERFPIVNPVYAVAQSNVDDFLRVLLSAGTKSSELSACYTHLSNFTWNGGRYGLEIRLTMKFSVTLFGWNILKTLKSVNFHNKLIYFYSFPTHFQVIVRTSLT